MKFLPSTNYNLLTTRAKREKGFTLIEFLVYMGILAIFLIVLTDIFTSTLSLQIDSESTSSIEQDGSYILSKLNKDINNADAVVTPSLLGSITNSIQVTNSGQTYTYLINNANLELINSLGTNNLNSYNTMVSNFTVERLGNAGPTAKNTLKISFTLTSINTQLKGNETQNFQTTIGIR